MPKSLNQVMKRLPAARRRKVEQRARELIREHLTLQQLSKELILTQESMAELLDMKDFGDLNTSTWMHEALEQMRCAFIRILRIPPREYLNHLPPSV
jgi:hypothetical protein